MYISSSVFTCILSPGNTVSEVASQKRNFIVCDSWFIDAIRPVILFIPPKKYPINSSANIVHLLQLTMLCNFQGKTSKKKKNKLPLLLPHPPHHRLVSHSKKNLVKLSLLFFLSLSRTRVQKPIHRHGSITSQDDWLSSSLQRQRRGALMHQVLFMSTHRHHHHHENPFKFSIRLICMHYVWYINSLYYNTLAFYCIFSMFTVTTTHHIFHTYRSIGLLCTLSVDFSQAKSDAELLLQQELVIIPRFHHHQQTRSNSFVVGCVLPPYLLLLQFS